MHPHLFRSVLGRVPEIAEYQVRQTPGGADILLQTAGVVDLAAVCHELTIGLGCLGLRAPRVTIIPVESIAHTSVGGKLKRFVPLAPDGAGLPSGGNPSM